MHAIEVFACGRVSIAVVPLPMGEWVACVIDGEEVRPIARQAALALLRAAGHHARAQDLARWMR